MKYPKFLRTPILKNTCERLLLEFVSLFSANKIQRKNAMKFDKEDLAELNRVSEIGF